MMKSLALLCALLPFIMGSPLGSPPGGSRPFTPSTSDPSVQFALTALNTHFAKSGDNNVRTLAKILSATKKVVQGMEYTYELEINGGATQEHCNLTVWSRPWLSKGERTLLVGEPQCSAVTSEAGSDVILPGGEVSIKPGLQDPYVLYAVSVINQHFAKQGDNDLRTAVKIIKATSQTVAGTLYRYTLEVTSGQHHEVCTVAVLSTPWLTPRDQTHTQEAPDCQTMASPAPSASLLPGSATPVDHDLQNPHVIFAMAAINSQFQTRGDNDVRAGVKVVKATSQVVQGAMYKYVLEISGGAQEELCSVSVWSRPWLSEEQRMVISGHPQCHAMEGPLNMRVGGEVPFKTDLENPDVMFAVNGINDMYQKAGDNALRSAVRLMSATSKVVSGALYTFLLEITGGEQAEICSVQVWSRPWLTGADKTKISGAPKCQPKFTFLAESSPRAGAEGAVDFLDQDVQKALGVLELSANSKANGPGYLKATGAASVYRQLVNGFVYRFESVSFSQTQCSKAEAVKGDAAGRCPLKDTQSVMTCNASVWYNPRQVPVYQLTDIECH